MGRTLGEADDPLLVSVRSGAQVLDARDDGDRPQHRAQRRVGARAWPSSPATSGSPGTPTAGCIQMFGKTVLDIDGEHFEDALDAAQEGQGHRRTTSTSTRDDLRTLVDDVQGHRRASTPAGSSRRTRASRWTSPSARSSTPGTPTARCSTAARSASRPTSAPRSTSARWCSATSAWTPAPASPSPATRRTRRTRASTATTCRTPRARTSSPASATPSRWTTSRASTRRRYDELLGDHGDAREPLPRPVRHRVHHRARQALDAADPGRQAHRRRRRSGSPTQLVDEGLIDLDEALRRVTGAQLAQLMFPRFDDAGDAQAARQGHERLARRGRRQGGLRLRHRGRVGRARARRSSWSAARPTPTTSTA